MSGSEAQVPEELAEVNEASETEGKGKGKGKGDSETEGKGKGKGKGDSETECKGKGKGKGDNELDDQDKKDDADYFAGIYFLDFAKCGSDIRSSTTEALKRIGDGNVLCGEIQKGGRVYIKPNSVRESKAQFFVRYGWYDVLDILAGSTYKLQATAQLRQGQIVELGPSEGKITSAHLRTVHLFEAIMDRALEERKTQVKVAAGSLATAGRLAQVPSGVWSLIFDFLVPANTTGVFTFAFDRCLVSLLSSCRSLFHRLAMHPVWIKKVLGLSNKHVGALLACPGMTASAIARYISLNAGRLPDTIRKDPGFRQILEPNTRHDIAEKQARASVVPVVEPTPKVRSCELLSTFLMGEPNYRGDVDNDPITAELLAVCQKVAKEDPVFVLKLAHYTRHTLTFRNTANFLLATAVKLDPCRPFVRLAVPKCTNLPTDLLELWDYWRKLSGRINLPSSLKKGFALKFDEFSEYQLGKYLNAKVPKPSQVAPQTGGKTKGKGKGKDKGNDNLEEKKAEEAAVEDARYDPLKRPLTLKTLIRTVHAGKKNPEEVCGVLRKVYPETEAEFKDLNLDCKGKEFDSTRSGEKLRIPIPKTWETQLSEKGNTPEVWQDLVKSRNLPFMAMIKNLRNIIMAGVDDETHDAIIKRLTTPREIENCKQTPVRFLSAFDAIDFDETTLERLVEEAASGQVFVEEEKSYGQGKDAKKVIRKRLVSKRPPSKKLLDRYRDALEKAVSLAARKNVPEIPMPTVDGKMLVLVDVSASMDAALTTGPKKFHEKAMVPHRRATGRPLVEGQDFDLEDHFSQFGQRLSKKVSFSMTWIGQDMDLSLCIMNKAGNTLQNVSYSNKYWTGVEHSGDITSAPHGAEEVISVDLDKIPEDAFFLAFTCNSFSGQPFDQLAEAAVSFRDDGLEGDSIEGTQEICAFRLTGPQTAVIGGALIRKKRGWAFRCLNTPGQGATVQSVAQKIRKDFEATEADAATSQKRLVDAALLLALCLRERLTPERVEIVLFSSKKKGGEKGYKVMRSLGPKVLSNVRRCLAEVDNLGSGTELPIDYLQEVATSGEKLDYFVLLTDGLVSPVDKPEDALGRWLRSYRDNVQSVKYVNIDLLGMGQANLGASSCPDDVLVSGYSEAVLRYLSSEPGAQVREIEAIEMPLPRSEKKD